MAVKLLNGHGLCARTVKHGHVAVAGVVFNVQQAVAVSGIEFHATRFSHDAVLQFVAQGLAHQVAAIAGQNLQVLPFIQGVQINGGVAHAGRNVRDREGTWIGRHIEFGSSQSVAVVDQHLVQGGCTGIGGRLVADHGIGRAGVAGVFDDTEGRSSGNGQGVFGGDAQTGTGMGHGGIKLKQGFARLAISVHARLVQGVDFSGQRLGQRI